MCRFHLTESPSGLIKVLTGANKDEGVGICDEQIVTSIWAWVREYSRELRRKKMNLPPRQIPDAQVDLTWAKNFSVFSVVVVVLEEGTILEDITFSIILGNFCLRLAETLGIKLDGVDDVAVR